MNKRDDLIPDIQNALQAAPYNCKERANYLEQGVCPQCSKKSLWTWKSEPWNVQCNKKNSCGYTSTAKDLLPNIFTELSKRYVPTEKNPNATADAYLKYIRGFDINLIRGQYSQSVVHNNAPGPNKGANAPSVRFYLDEGKTRYFERVMENEDKVGKKAHFGGKRKADGTLFKGDVWQPQTLNINPRDTIYITEGIFDAIALNTAGFKAVSALSSGTFPIDFIKKHSGKSIKWMFALDNDKAGLQSTTKHLKSLAEIKQDGGCIFPYEGNDWNDLLNAKKLTAEHMKNFKHMGSCAMAESQEEKGILIYAHEGRSFFTFDYGLRKFGFNLDVGSFDDDMASAVEAYKKENKLTGEDKLPPEAHDELRNKALRSSAVVKEIANCVPEFLYTQKNPAADELSYFYRVSMPNGRVYKDTFTNGQQQTATKFNERLGSFAGGAMFDGEANYYNMLRKQWMGNVKEIRAIDYAGYDEKSKGYVFPKFAVIDSKVHKLNNEEFIDTGKVQVKSDYHNVKIDCNTDLADYNDDWFKQVHKAWGTNGLIACAYFTGAVFANQIRDRLQNFPFLELVGDPGTGKSALLKALWESFGRAGHEGTNPGGRKGTAKFLPRVLAQTTLPTVFVEGDAGAVNWDDFKDLYGGIGLYGKANMSNDNQIKISDFRGSLVIAQNLPVKDAQPAFLERIVHCYFSSKDQNDNTAKAFDALQQIESANMSGYLVKVIQNEKRFLEVFFNIQKQVEAKLQQDPDIKTRRVAFTHSVIAGLIKASQLVLPIDNETASAALTSVKAMAHERQNFINAEDPRVESYFDAIEFMEGMIHNKTNFNHSKKPELYLAIDLAHVESEARRHGVNVPPMVELKPLLEQAQCFVKKNHSVGSSITGKTKKCWLFKSRPKLKDLDGDGLEEVAA